jgi:hypothetical protein
MLNFPNGQAPRPAHSDRHDRTSYGFGINLNFDERLDPDACEKRAQLWV